MKNEWHLFKLRILKIGIEKWLRWRNLFRDTYDWLCQWKCTNQSVLAKNLIQRIDPWHSFWETKHLQLLCWKPLPKNQTDIFHPSQRQKYKRILLKKCRRRECLKESNTNFVKFGKGPLTSQIHSFFSFRVYQKEVTLSNQKQKQKTKVMIFENCWLNHLHKNFVLHKGVQNNTLENIHNINSHNYHQGAIPNISTLNERWN